MTEMEWQRIKRELLGRLQKKSHVAAGEIPGLMLDMDDEYDLVVEDRVIRVVRGDGDVIKNTEQFRVGRQS